MEPGSQILTIEKINKSRLECVEFIFKEIGLVILGKQNLDMRVLSMVKPGSTVLAQIEESSIPYISKLDLLVPFPFYRK